MPHHSPRADLPRVAIVGAGISGLSAAHALAPHARVDLIEAAPRLGGHARTVIAGKRGDQPVDTGFIVFNKVNYPNLVALFDEIDAPVAASDMSFAASFGQGALEYSLQTADTMFAQRSNLLRPRFLRMVRDIFRFNARAADLATDEGLPLGLFLDRMGMSRAFRDWYLGPISGAIWSTPAQDVMEFPAAAMLRFFRNHHLLSHTGQHDWFTVAGGSAAYVSRLEARLRMAGVGIRTAAPVAAIERPAEGGVRLRARGGAWEDYDHVVLATHADTSHALLTDADPREAALLGAVRFQANRAVLHADDRLMPRRRKVWASWNYAEPGGARPDRIGLTYWMNRLQPIPEDDPLFVTLNPQVAPRDELVHDETEFAHPVYDLAMMAAVEDLKAGNGARDTWFAGAWMRYGFHEDGMASGLDAAEGIRARRALALAAE